MYTLTLETNTLCNLNCRYCYLGEKTQKEMSLNVCKQSIDIAIHETNKQYDKTLFICFLGGEPLLSIDFIEDAVMYAKPLCEEKGLNILFGVTTNGTIYNNKIKKILLDHKFSIRVSIDGNEETQNLNRLDYYENGSYQMLLKNLPEFMDICVQNDIILRGVQVITTNNAPYYFQNFKHLVELGIKYIESGPNNYDDWRKEDIQILTENLAKANKYFETISKNKQDVFWNLYYQHLQRFIFPKRCFYTCMAGLSSVFINTDGNIYFCRETDDSMKIGNVDIGLNIQRIREIIYIKDTQNKECLECQYIDHCYAKSCFIENYAIMGDIFTPVKINCEIVKFYSEYFNINLSIEDIERIKNTMTEMLGVSC